MFALWQRAFDMERMRVSVGPYFMLSSSPDAEYRTDTEVVIMITTATMMVKITQEKGLRLYLQLKKFPY